jgi:hypothetical protein
MAFYIPYLNLFVQFKRAGRNTMTFHQWLNTTFQKDEPFTRVNKSSKVKGN